MPSTLLTAATDIFVIASAAAMTTAALNSKFAAFNTSLGVEDSDDDSLVAAKADDAVGASGRRRPALQRIAGGDKTTPTVTVSEVAVTPPLTEMQEDGFFTGAKVA